VLRALGLGPHQCIFAGNGGSNELEGAQNVGFKLVVFVHHFVSHNNLYPPEKLRQFCRQADIAVAYIGELVKLVDTP
jgi:FMN phosphatase YigB (HAD superfamily)